ERLNKVVNVTLTFLLRFHHQNSQRPIVPSLVAVHQPFERLTDRRGWVTMLSSQIILSRKWATSGLE
ncbi:hypothetical protein, partial [Lactiplantibacillus plantarum]|uniref:hypothetical protein n=1 Tax=Lactiplantibacillus plantarum TaxID=1590 RepID=UPI00223F90A6